MIVQILLEIELSIRLGGKKVQEKFHCVRFGWVFTVADSSISCFLMCSAPLILCTTLSSFGDNKPVKSNVREGS